MNRIVKYRAWDKLDKKMYYNVGISMNGVQIYKDKNIPETVILDRGKSCMELMQFTGLRDKNGKMIFEGDIVDYKCLYGSNDMFGIAEEYYKESDKFFIQRDIVKFYDGQFLPREYYFDCGDSYYSYRYYDFEIIGNLFETPELLNK